MIVSMTGYGAAQTEDGGVGYSLEIRSVNNRYLKLHIKLPEDLQFAEPDMDRLIRSKISRGTVTCSVRRRCDAGEVAKSLNLAALQRYVDLLAGVRSPTGVGTTIDLAFLLAEIVVLLLLLDDRRRGRIHAPYLWLLGLTLLQHASFVLLERSLAWQSITDWIAS